MRKARQLCAIACGALLAVSGCVATDDLQGEAPAPAPVSAVSVAKMGPVLSPSVGADLPAAPALPTLPTVEAQDRPMPINLPTALRLANVQGIDIAAAAARIKAAGAGLEKAQVLWLPTVTFGSDYFRHDGLVQDNTSGDILDNSHQGMVLGAGPTVNLDIGEAIFAPLVARQQLAARQADLQTASNDTLVMVTDAYFTVQQARGELAGAIEARQRSEQLLARTKELAKDLVPQLEVVRAEAELARRQQAENLAHERWQVASADLVRVLRLDAAAQVEPAEPPHLRVELIDVNQPVDDLIVTGLTNRPELAAQQAQVQATVQLLRQEKLRPLIPSLLVRGFSTPVAGGMSGGYAFYGNNGSLTNSQFRSDIDVELLWRLDNLGFGNRAAIHQREANNSLAMVELFRVQDRVAAEVAQAYAQARQAAGRVALAEKETRAARESLDKNMLALKATKGADDKLILVVRPQEVVAAVQELAQSYADYYGAVADANRAQFRLYRAMGRPAHSLVLELQVPAVGAPAPLPTPPDVPSKTKDL